MPVSLPDAAHDVLHRLTSPPYRRELVLLLLLSLIAGGTWGFIELADEVLEGETMTMDERLLRSLRSPIDTADPLGPLWVEELGRDITALGGVGILTLLTLAAAGYLSLRGKHRTALFTILAIGSGVLLSFLLKEGFDRPRPDLVPHEAGVYTTSFPSGHSMMAAVTYLTLALLLARTHARKRVKSYLLVLALLVTIAIGVSRVYLGVHWPTDVLAGWTAGGVWALLCWLVVLLLQERGRIEAEM